jgi:hypothetical protein
MMKDEDHSVDEHDAAAAAPVEPAVPGAAPGKSLSPEAIRALQEAEARRVAATDASNGAAAGQKLPSEIGGRREGEDPTRYGDYEKKGLAVDF